MKRTWPIVGWDDCDATRGDAMNYGGIGAVIGHKISHSFDNNGANFDAHGRLSNWWTPSDLAHFHASTHALALQYDAFHASLGGKPAPTVGGLTGDQQFFLSFGQIWRTKFREPALRRQLLTNGHSPGPYRALTVRNLDAWYGPFDVKANEKLYLPPANRVRIW